MNPQARFSQHRWQILFPSLFFLLMSLSQVFLFFTFEDLDVPWQLLTVVVGPFILLSFGFAGLSGLSSVFRGGRSLIVYENGLEDQTLLRHRGWQLAWEQVERITTHTERLEIFLKDRDAAIAGLPKWQRAWLRFSLGKEHSLLLDAQFLETDFSDLKSAVLQSWETFQTRAC